MKILYSLSNPGDRLGVERAGHIVRVNALLRELLELGHQIVRLEAAEERGTQIAVSAYRGIFKKYFPKYPALVMRDLGRMFHSRQYAQRLARMIEVNKPDFILETYLAFNMAGKIASEITNVPLVVDDLAPVWEEEQLYGVGLKKTLRRVYREVTEEAKLLIAVNKTIKQYLLQEGVSEGKISIVENGIDDKLFNPRVDGRNQRIKFGIGSEETVVVFVGSFQPYHRVDLLLQAFSAVETDRSIRLLLVGEGVSAKEAKSLASDLGLGSRAIFTGRVPYDEVPAYMAAGDIAVMPATNEYGNPMKIYEYMALGKPVIAPNQNTILEIAEHNKTAYLVERENINALKAALQTLIEDAAFRRRLGGQAGAAAKKHTWQIRARAMQEALQAIKLSNG